MYLVETKTVLWNKQNLKEIKSFLKLHNPNDINTNQVRPTHLLIPEPYIIWESQKAIKSTAIISHTYHTSSFQKKTPYYARVKAMKLSYLLKPFYTFLFCFQISTFLYHIAQPILIFSRVMIFHTSSFQKKTPYYAKVKAMKSSYSLKPFWKSDKTVIRFGRHRFIDFAFNNQIRLFVFWENLQRANLLFGFIWPFFTRDHLEELGIFCTCWFWPS